MTDRQRTPAGIRINRILALPAYRASSAFGASMGRMTIIGQPGPLHLQRITFMDGDYDRGGAYWGGPPSDPLWCAFSVSGSKSQRLDTMLFARAQTRKRAAQLIWERLRDILGDDPFKCGWRFYR